MFKRVSEVRTRRFCGCELVNLVDLMNLKGLSYVRGSASPFIDKGDGFTSERVMVRMLLSFVAHADGYKIMVGAYNTVGRHCKVSDACGRLCLHSLGMVDVGTCRYYLMPRGT